MTYLRQVIDFALAHLRVWWRRPIEAFVSGCLAVAYLLIANQAFSLWIGDNVTVGLYAPDAGIRQTLLLELDRIGVRTLLQDTEQAGRDAVAQGHHAIFVSVEGFDPLRFRIVLGGRNPLLDRELSGYLLRTASRVLQREVPLVRIEVENDRYGPEMMTAFMTAGMMVFFILSLLLTANGNFWVRDWEYGMIHTLLATPAHRTALVLGRLLGSMLISVGLLAVSVVLCRLWVPWPWPERWLAWFGVILVHMFSAGGLFFLIASLCRRYRFYVNVCSFLIVALMFISGAVSPVEIMPKWQSALAVLSPAYYGVRSMRAVMLATEPVRAMDLVVLGIWGVVTHILGYIRLVRATIRE